MIKTAKIFGTGQITLPKEWRARFKTNTCIITESSQGLLIKPLEEDIYYEIDDENFGISFPMGIPASKLAKKIKIANAKISKTVKKTRAGA